MIQISYCPNVLFFHCLSGFYLSNLGRALAALELIMFTRGVLHANHFSLDFGVIDGFKVSLYGVA